MLFLPSVRRNAALRWATLPAFSLKRHQLVAANSYQNKTENKYRKFFRAFLEYFFVYFSEGFCKQLGKWLS